MKETTKITKMIFSNESRHAVVAFIGLIFSSQSQTIERELVLKWFEIFSGKMNRMVKDKGLVHSIKTMKMMQLNVTRFLAGSPIVKNDLRIGLTKEGLPKWLIVDGSRLIVDNIIKRDPFTVRAILTAFNASRLHLGDGTLDSTTIEEKSTSSEELEVSIVKKLQESVWGLNLKNKLSLLIQENLWSKPHLTTKVGPNGHALGTAHIELLSLPSWLLDSIYKLGGNQLKTYMETLREGLILVKDKLEEGNPCDTFRRISVKPDKALKNRPIAILDYWSQSALLPLHNALFRLFESFSNDMTFDQKGIGRYIGKWDSYHSLDLSAATDRFPISLQEAILGFLADKEYAENWSQVMIRLPFVHKEREYKYNAGQPMGAYSSWAMFALSHHVVVQYSASLASKKWERLGSFEHYAILGDDIVIGDREVAIKYKEVIKGLGVEIAEAKSHEGISFVEFAKNSWMITDTGVFENVSGVPLNGILRSKSSLYDLSQELTELVSRGTIRETDVTDPVLLSGFISKLYDIPIDHRSNSRLCTKIGDWWRVTEAYEWVKKEFTKVDTSSSKPRHCNHTPLDTLRFYVSLLLQDIKDFSKSAWVELSKKQGGMLIKIRELQQKTTGLSHAGPSEIYFPTFIALKQLPYKVVIENQIGEASKLFKLIPKEMRSGQFDLERSLKRLSDLRICDPEVIDSRRMSDVIRNIRRRVTARLLPWEESR